jgi:signal peptidase I
MIMSKSMMSGFLKQVRELAVILLVAFVIRTFGFGLYQVPTGSMETTMLVGERFFADKFSYLFSKPARGDIISLNEPNYPYSKNRFKNLFERYVWGPQNWTKRIVGIPGDSIKGVIEEGKPIVYLNGQKLDESYLNKYPLVPVSIDTWKSYDPEKPFDKQPFYTMNSYEVKRAQRFFESRGMRTILYPGTPVPAGSGSDIFEVQLQDNQYWVMGDNRLGSADSRQWGILDGTLIHGKIIWRLWSIDSDQSWWILDLLLHPIEFWSRVRWNRCFERVK